jgi:hypothetical protein
MPTVRPYQQVYDGSTARTIGTVVDNPTNNEFLPVGAQNRRAVLGTNQQGYSVSDMGVNPRGAKNILWSSEGYVTNGITVSALTANQKKATNTTATTIATTQTLPTQAPNAVTLPTTLDVSAYSGIVIVVNLTAITGTSIQFEYDFVDDAANTVALWKPTALTAAGGYITMISQYATASAPSGPSGWTFANIAFPQGPQGRFAWTCTAVTADTWTAYIYGLN